MTKKKNRFFTFWFSLIPGAGEMYMGFMKMGVSLMSLVFLCCVIAAYLNLPVFLYGLPIIWFYSFFNVHNLRALGDEEFFAVEDDYVFHISSLPFFDIFWLKKSRKIISIVLIFFGATLLWSNLLGIINSVTYSFEVPPFVYQIIGIIGNSVPRIVIALGIIALGVQMIKGRKNELLTDNEEENII